MDNAGNSVYGFRVSISLYDEDYSSQEGVDVYVPLWSYHNRIFRTYYSATNALFATPDQGISVGGTTMTLTISPALDPAKVQFMVYTINMDGIESSAATQVATFT